MNRLTAHRCDRDRSASLRRHFGLLLRPPPAVRRLQEPSESVARVVVPPKGGDRKQVLDVLDAGRFDEAREMVFTPVVRKKIHWYCEQEREKIRDLEEVPSIGV